MRYSILFIRNQPPTLQWLRQVLSQYASVLECLLRLRQVCCSVTLVPTGRLEQAKKVLNQLAAAGPTLGKEVSPDL